MVANWGQNHNPTGKGGFKDHPEFRNMTGTWKSEDSIGFQYKKLIRLTVDEFKDWTNKHRGDKRTIAQELAYNAVVAARRDLAYLREVTDRTEGRAKQDIKINERLEVNFDDETIDRIAARRISRKSDGDTSGKK